MHDGPSTPHYAHFFGGLMRFFTMQLKPYYEDMTETAIVSKKLIIGWGKVPGLLRQGLSREDIKRGVKATWKGMSNREAGNAAGELDRFLGIQNGDLVAVPSGDSVFVARAGANRKRQLVRGKWCYTQDAEWLNPQRPFHLERVSDVLKRKLTNPHTCLDVTDKRLGSEIRKIGRGAQPLPPTNPINKRGRVGSRIAGYKGSYNYLVGAAKRSVYPAHRNYEERLRRFLSGKKVIPTFEENNVDVRFSLAKHSYIGEIKIAKYCGLKDGFRMSVGQLIDYADLEAPALPGKILFLEQELDPRRVLLATYLNISVVIWTRRSFYLMNSRVSPSLKKVFSVLPSK